MDELIKFIKEHWKDIVPITISVMALLFSIFTFIYNWYLNKVHLKIKFKGKSHNFFRDSDKNLVLSLDCSIYNKSKIPIRITAVQVKWDNYFMQALPISSIMSSDGFVYCDNNIDLIEYNLKIPTYLDSFDGFPNTTLIFAYPYVEIPEFTKRKITITFQTSRGILKKKILANYKHKKNND